MCNKCVIRGCNCKCNADAVQITQQEKSRRVGDGTLTIAICKECMHELQINKASGCFIATAAYGTPFAEEINVLREWRDKDLLTNPFGRAFVSFYYRISPPIANLIEKSELSKRFVRVSLNPFIRHLKRKKMPNHN